jgi:hypothetical protein
MSNTGVFPPLPMGPDAQMRAAVSIFRLLRDIPGNKSFEPKDQRVEAQLQSL